MWKLKRLNTTERAEYERLWKINQEMWEAFQKLPHQSMAFKLPFHPYGAETEHQPLLLNFMTFLDDLNSVLQEFEWPDRQIDRFPLVYQRRRGFRVNGPACITGLKDQDNLFKLALDQKIWSKIPRLMRIANKSAKEIISPPPL